MTDTDIASVPLLRVDHVTKFFPDVVANDHISFEVKAGEVLCLLGENGAGKTTLVDILYGVHQPDDGELVFEGEPVRFKNPGEAIEAGIGMVHQHFELVTPMSALENVVIGTEDAHRTRIAAARAKLQNLCDQYGINIDLDVEVGLLSVGEQQWIEILKALFTGVKLLILDEPTAVLTPQGVQRLFGAIREMKKNGIGVVLVTHKLWEVMEISDRVVVLRKGQLVDIVNTVETNDVELARLMVGRDVVLNVAKEPATPGDVMLEVQGVAAPGRSGRSGRGALHDLTFELRSGEILGLAGVSGNGQSALFDVLVGVNPPTAGTIHIGGVETTGATPKKIAALGLSGVPSDRIRQGLMMDFEIQENLILGSHRSSSFMSHGLLNEAAIRDFAVTAIKEFEIATPSPLQKTRVLSGGNLQKVILARELLGHPPRILVIHQPTRGLDIGASEYVRRCLVEQRDRGAGVLLISEDLDEIFNLSDRVIVIYRGEIIGEVDPADANFEEIGLLMAGISKNSNGKTERESSS